jgi:hypothetical protein
VATKFKWNAGATVATILLIMFGLVQMGDHMAREQARLAAVAAANDRLTVQQRAAADEQRFNKMSPWEHIDAAKKLLVVDAPKTSVDLAEKHLAATPIQNAREVAAIRAAFKRAQAQADNKRQKIATDEEKKKDAEAQHLQEVARVALASYTENQMLSQGFDMKVTARGPQHRTLRIEWALMNRPAIYEMFHTPTFFNNLTDAGFAKVIATDGYEQTWKWDLF